MAPNLHLFGNLIHSYVVIVNGNSLSIMKLLILKSNFVSKNVSKSSLFKKNFQLLLTMQLLSFFISILVS